jgi:hypothetical protein
MVDQTVPAPPVSGSMSEGIRQVAKILLDMEPTDLQKFCEVAVMDLDPGMDFPSPDFRTMMSEEQARHAVAATLATLAYFDKLPRGLIR